MWSWQYRKQRIHRASGRGNIASSGFTVHLVVAISQAADSPCIWSLQYRKQRIHRASGRGNIASSRFTVHVVMAISQAVRSQISQLQG
ncbi:MAG TPA: hypothetical protein PLD25_02130 [Chloroflexota bacterium]|nr:hypothetical protein [Chloroflexota bacterium]HUM67404.1 hypothetical protein [Chloroflexota bacterium]